MANANAAVAQPAETKPKMMIAIEHLDRANDHMNKSMAILSSVIFDLQKGADFIAQYRDSLVKTVEQAGGDVTASIEAQIRQFIPPSHRERQGSTE